MNYTASVSDFFKSPKWGMNLLLGGVTMLIPLVGPLVLSGWLIGGFWARGDDDDPVTIPPFDFQDFMKYLERGLWPFLVNLVASLVMVPLSMVLVFLPIMLTGVMAPLHGGHESGVLAALVIMAALVLYLLLMLAFCFIITPLILRATILQDFAPSFNFAFVKNFLALMWQDLVVTMVFLFCLGIGLTFVGMLLCIVGILFTVPLSLYSWSHLQKQLYRLYVSRGGEPLPLSPKLRDIPPPPPFVPPSLSAV